MAEKKEREREKRFPRVFPRGSLETKRKTDYIHVLSVVESTFFVVIEKKRGNFEAKKLRPKQRREGTKVDDTTINRHEKDGFISLEEG